MHDLDASLQSYDIFCKKSSGLSQILGTQKKFVEPRVLGSILVSWISRGRRKGKVFATAVREMERSPVYRLFLRMWAFSSEAANVMLAILGCCLGSCGFSRPSPTRFCRVCIFASAFRGDITRLATFLRLYHHTQIVWIFSSPMWGWLLI